MGTRTIITSQPDVACDVCQRRLLRGELPEIFLAGDQPRTVCELCVPRAAHQGWTRETDGVPPSPVPVRPRRGRSLFERLRAGGRNAEELRAGAVRPGGDEPAPYDFLGGAGAISGETARPEAYSAPALGEAGAPAVLGSSPSAAPVSAGASEPEREGAYEDWALQRAVDIFNAGEHPRRIAGVARSLGTPVVSVLSVEHIDGLVSIVVAWELCWYRYRIDLDDPAGGVCEAVQGTELAELAADERTANAVADPFGLLALQE